VPDVDHQDHKPVILNLVYDPVFTDPDAQETRHPHKRFCPGRPGVGGQYIDGGTDALSDRPV
jgi:hypothetical protein